MKSWKLILAVLVIFGAGVVTGGMLVRVRIPAAHPAEAAPVAASATGGPQMPGFLGQGRQQFVQRLNRQLNLTPSQAAEVDHIMDSSHDRVLKIWDPIAPQVREETRKVRNQIYAVLDSQQKTKFDENFRPHRVREIEPNKARRDRDTNALGKEAPRARP